MKTRMGNVMLGAILVSLPLANLAAADLPVVPGFTVEVYAELPDPVRLCFTPDGVMYVGNRNLASPVNSAYRIEPGGASWSLYGPALWKACAVGYDKDGLISGIPGTLLAAGGMDFQAHLTAIFPNETARTLWQGPFVGPADIAFDSTGRMLLVDATDRNVYQSHGGTPTVLLTVPLQDCHCMALDRNDNIFVSMGYYGAARVLAYRSDGIPIGSPILQGQITTWSPFPIAFGKGGIWGHSLYVIVNHVLMRFDDPLASPGTFTTIGTGFNYNCYDDMEVGPDGGLYVSSSFGDQILRIAPSNSPPRALCQDVMVHAGSDCLADASVDDGSYDPDGDPITITQDPLGPYPLGTTPVTLTVADSHGSSSYCTAAVTVVDASKPEITSVTPDWQVIPVGSAANFVVAVEDNCSCAQTIWQFDVDNPLPEELGDCDSMSHIYATTGIYTVEVVAVDDAGNVSDPAFVHVVVYDPFGGFVTGGGWIWSPEGAFTDNPSAAGRADFGFISKYKKGTTVPTGQTEFTFQAGDLDFYSNNYEWLVVTGSNYARFKGTGTINGSGVYKFMLWAGDGAPDTFRIKIWTESTTEGGVVEDVVYDNGMDQAISRGSIVVHTK